MQVNEDIGKVTQQTLKVICNKKIKNYLFF